MGSFVGDAIFDGVESGEGSSKSLVGGVVIHVGEPELADSLSFKDADTSLEGLSEHEVLVEGVLEDLVVESLLFVLVLVCGGSLVLSARVDDLLVLELSISDVLGFLVSGESICLGLLVVGKVKLIFLHSVFVVRLFLEGAQFSGSLTSLFGDSSLLFGGLFFDVSDALSEVLVEDGDGSVVISLSLDHLDGLLLLELLELTVNSHLDHLSLLMHLFSVVSLEIGEDGSGRDEDFGDLEGIDVDTEAVADLLHLGSDLVTDGSALFQAVAQGSVSDLVTDDGSDLLLDQVVGGLRVG